MTVILSALILVALGGLALWNIWAGEQEARSIRRQRHEQRAKVKARYHSHNSQTMSGQLQWR